MDNVNFNKNDDIFETIKGTIKNNPDSKIYLTGDIAWELYKYANRWMAEKSVQTLNSNASLLCYRFENAGVSDEEIKIKRDNNDMSKYQVISFISKNENEDFIYTYSRNCEKRLVQAREIIICEAKTTEKQTPVRRGEF